MKKIKKKYNVSMDIKPAFGTSGGTPPGNPSGCPQLQYNTSLQPDIQSGYGWWETSLLCPDNQQPQNNPYGGEYCPTWWQWTGFVWPWDDNCDPSTYGSYQGGVSCIEVVGCESYGIGNSNAQSATMHNEMCELGCWNCIWCEMHGECISQSDFDAGYCCDEAGNCQGDILSLPSQGYNGEYRDHQEFGEQGWMQGICFTTCGAADPTDNSWQCGGGCEVGNFVWCDCCDGLPYPGTNSGISCDGVDLDWPPDSWSYLPIASNSHDGGASGGCAPIWNVDCGCCCHDYCDSPECSSNIYSHDCHLDGDDVFFNPDAWCANTNCTDQEPSDLCIIPGDPPTWKTCDSFCDCNGLADCFSHYGGSCNSSTGNCEWTTDPSSCTPGGCNGLGDYSSGTDCAPDPCALGATSAGGVVCPIAICECDGDDGGPPCYIKHNNCIMANCACNGVEGYESGGVVWSDELGEHEVIGTYCYYPTSIYCDDEGYSACSAEGCSDWCSGNAALCDDVKCGNNTELDPTNTKFYLHTNKNCSGSTCGFDSIEECTFNYMGIEMPAGCLNGTTCSTDPCEIINIDCTKAVCNSDSTLIEYGGDCNSETGECVAMQTKICQWGCYHGEVSDGCNGPPTCLDGELLNCNLLPVDECCPAGWVGDGWGDCSQQDFGCDLSCYENSDGDPCLEPNCMDGGDCLGWHACNNPYFPYSGSWGEVGGVMSPWCDACGGASTWAYGSCCCDSFCAEFGLSCADLKDMYGLLCDGCLCPCDGDNYDSCYNVGFDDPWPGEYFPDGSSCCPWPYLKSCDRDNPMCGRVERLGDNGCDEPGLGGGHDGMDNRCYFNDGGDCD